LFCVITCYKDPTTLKSNDTAKWFQWQIDFSPIINRSPFFHKDNSNTDDNGGKSSAGENTTMLDHVVGRHVFGDKKNILTKDVIQQPQGNGIIDSAAALPLIV